MRGGYIHNRVLLDPIAQRASQLGAQVDREVAITVGSKVLYGDLLIQGRSKRILVEAELSSRRIPNDLAKAAAVGACELWLVVPNPRVARSVRQKLLCESIGPGKSGLFVLLFSQAVQRLEELSELNSGSNADTKKKKQKWKGNNPALS